MSDQAMTFDHGTDMACPSGDADSFGVVVATIAECCVRWRLWRSGSTTKTVQRMLGPGGD